MIAVIATILVRANTFWLIVDELTHSAIAIQIA